MTAIVRAFGSRCVLTHGAQVPVRGGCRREGQKWLPRPSPRPTAAARGAAPPPISGGNPRRGPAGAAPRARSVTRGFLCLQGLAHAPCSALAEVSAPQMTLLGVKVTERPGSGRERRGGVCRPAGEYFSWRPSSQGRRPRPRPSLRPAHSWGAVETSCRHPVLCPLQRRSRQRRRSARSPVRAAPHSPMPSALGPGFHAAHLRRRPGRLRHGACISHGDSAPDGPVASAARPHMAKA